MTMMRSRWILFGLIILGVGLMAYPIHFIYECYKERRSLPFEDSFSQGRLSDWDVFGGSWEPYEGGVRNNSDERGAKLVGGNPNWKNYQLDLDLQILGSAGDVGAIVRATAVEDGVDSYSGYYVGLRNSNNTLVIGRADHGWMEYQVVAFPGSVKVSHWYHLTINVWKCTISAEANDIRTGETARVALHETTCAENGRIGLRSYSSGGIWKNIKVKATNERAIKSFNDGSSISESPRVLQTEFGFNSALASDVSIGRTNGKSPTETIDKSIPIANIGELSFTVLPKGASVRVHGSVSLAGQKVYLQDSTGGAVLTNLPKMQIHIGDELEVSGVPDLTPFDTRFDSPRVHVLRSREPAPAFIITATQAATGQFANRFVEVEGTLKSTPHTWNNYTVLDLESNQQQFRVMLSSAEQDTTLGSFLPHSRVRLRGICVIDSAFNQLFIPFAIILRSDSDIALISGPPWWSVRRIMEISWIGTVIGFIGIMGYFQIEQWRLLAVTEERSRLAREIHDTLAQSFAAITFQLESSLIEETPGSVQPEPIRLALQMARQSRKDAYLTIATLRSMHTESSLTGMLESVLKPICVRSGVVYTMSSGSNIPDLDPDIAHQVLRIAQETVSNAIRHSGCLSVRIAISASTDGITLRIADDGRGFDVSQNLNHKHTRFGLIGMRERARSIHAGFTITAGSTGTVVILRLPEWKRPRLHLLRQVGKYLGHRISLSRVPTSGDIPHEQ